jgi:hypothetical protein
MDCIFIFRTASTLTTSHVIPATDAFLHLEGFLHP